MLFSRHQSPGEPIRVDGSLLNLYNLRPGEPVTPRRKRRSPSSSSPSPQYHLSGIHRPAEVCGMTRTPVGVDHRNMRANLLSVDADGNLYFEGIVNSDSSFTPRGELIAAGTGTPRQMARAGHFLVLLLAGGDLFYLMWESATQDYTALGRLPGVPTVTVERVDEADQPMYVDPTVFAAPVALENGGALPEDAVDSIGHAMRNAWADALLTARRNGRFVQPVKVRVALRLFDDSLYAMTEPVTVGTEDDLVGYGRALLPPVVSNGFLLGTEKTKGYVSTYRLGVTVADIPAALWHTVIKSVEVFVSEEPTVTTGTSGTASYSAESHAVLAHLGTRARREVMESISSVYMRSLAAAPLPNGQTQMQLTVSTVQAALQAVGTLTPPLGKADCMAGAGAFLHVCADGLVSTMRRNNPFAVSASTDSGSQVCAMKPLPVAGGAYTRSYLYMMTDAGVMALTHDSQGRHTNCRPIAPYTVENPEAVVHGGNGVWALSTCGMLMFIKGSAVEYVMSGLDPGCTLARDARHDELWILPASGAADFTMVMRGVDRLGYTRSYDNTGTLVSREDQLLQSVPGADGAVSILDLSPAHTALLPGSFEKEVEVPDDVRSGRTAKRRAEIGMCRYSVCAQPDGQDKCTLEVRYALPKAMQPQDIGVVGSATAPLFTTLCSTEVESVYDGPAENLLVFRRPEVLRVLPDWQERYRLCGSGVFRSVTV